jgi:hypothetical protein
VALEKVADADAEDAVGAPEQQATLVGGAGVHQDPGLKRKDGGHAAAEVFTSLEADPRGSGDKQ